MSRFRHNPELPRNWPLNYGHERHPILAVVGVGFLYLLVTIFFVILLMAKAGWLNGFERP